MNSCPVQLRIEFGKQNYREDVAYSNEHAAMNSSWSTFAQELCHILPLDVDVSCVIWLFWEQFLRGT